MIHTINGIQYRVQRENGRWHAATWCDCILGPHWHYAADNANKRDLLALLRAVTRSNLPGGS